MAVTSLLVCRGFRLFVFLPARPTVRPTISPTDQPSVRLTVRPFVRKSARPSVQPSVRPFDRPILFCLFVSLLFITNRLFHSMRNTSASNTNLSINNEIHSKYGATNRSKKESGADFIKLQQNMFATKSGRPSG